MENPKLWVRVVEAHATRTWVALILAMSAGLSLLMLVAAAMWNTISNPEVTDLTANYSSVITATLGVLIGSLATYVGNAPGPTRATAEEFPRDDQIVLEVETPKEPPKPGPQC